MLTLHAVSLERLSALGLQLPLRICSKCIFWWVQIRDRPYAVELVDSKQGYGIELKDIRFGYRPELPILQVKPLLCHKTYKAPEASFLTS